MPTSVGQPLSRLATGHREPDNDREVSLPVFRQWMVWARLIVGLGIIAGVCYGAWEAIQTFGRPYDFFDLKIYHGAVVWWANGGELYQYVAPNVPLGFTYPPFAALVMLPMAGLS